MTVGEAVQMLDDDQVYRGSANQFRPVLAILKLEARRGLRGIVLTRICALDQRLKRAASRRRAWTKSGGRFHLHGLSLWSKNDWSGLKHGDVIVQLDRDGRRSFGIGDEAVG